MDNVFDIATNAVVIMIGDRYFCDYKNKRIITSWSLAGAKLFIRDDKINIIEKALKDKGKSYIKRKVSLSSTVIDTINTKSTK